MNLETKRLIIKILIIASITLLVSDFAYRTINDIDYFNREKCIIYTLLPEWGFLLYEYLFEFSVIVFAGIFIALLLERYFSRYGRFYPKTP
jgi:hypothetical protein